MAIWQYSLHLLPAAWCATHDPATLSGPEGTDATPAWRGATTSFATIRDALTQRFGAPTRPVGEQTWLRWTDAGEETEYDLIESDEGGLSLGARIHAGRSTPAGRRALVDVAAHLDCLLWPTRSASTLERTEEALTDAVNRSPAAEHARRSGPAS